MIGIIVILVSIYIYVFSDFSITGEQGVMLFFSALIEIIVEVIVGLAIFDFLKKEIK